MSSPLMTKQEVAEFLRVSSRTLEGWGPRRHPGYVKRAMYLREEVMRWLYQDFTDLTPESGTTDSRSEDESTGDRQAREIAERLKERRARLEARLSRKSPSDDPEKAAS